MDSVPLNRSPAWLIGRAVLALTLFIGFYVLAVGIAGGLLWIPYAELVYLERIDPRIAFVCIGAGGAILWSLRPRLDRFDPPWPRLHLEQHPRLREALEQVARATGETLPREVYLVPEVNAFVTQRGGVFGIGSRRVMGLGLPLMSALNVDEFRAVLAHEFGHYHGGDVALGPIVHRTRYAIGRTLRATAGSLVEQPFIAYGNLFLRVSSAVSRHQELVADNVAARTVSAAALASGLRRAELAGLAFPIFMHSEVGPLIHGGFVPPISDGFVRFCGESRIVTALASAGESRAADRYDSHPPLEERIAALEVTSTEPRASAPAAITLLEGVEELEFHVFGLDAVEQRLSPVAWEQTAARIYLPQWQALVAAQQGMLRDVDVAALPTRPADAVSCARELKTPGEGYVAGDELARRFAHAVGAAIGLTLIARGWVVETGPGRPMVLVHADETFAPIAAVEAVVFGRASIESWRATCARLGLEGKLGAGSFNPRKEETIFDEDAG